MVIPSSKKAEEVDLWTERIETSGSRAWLASDGRLRVNAAGTFFRTGRHASAGQVPICKGNRRLSAAVDVPSENRWLLFEGDSLVDVRVPSFESASPDKLPLAVLDALVDDRGGFLYLFAGAHKGPPQDFSAIATFRWHRFRLKR